MAADGVIGGIKERGEAKAAAWAEALLSSPALARLVQGIGGARVTVGGGTKLALRFLGLPCRDDYERASEVLSRSSRKLTALEANLARIEVLLDRMKAVPATFAPKARAVVEKPKTPKPIARPATPEPVAPAAPVATRPTLVPSPKPAAAPVPRTFAPPAKQAPANRAAAPVKAPRQRIFEVAVAGEPKAAQLLLGFQPKPRRTR